MKTLVLDTCLGACSAALLLPDKVIARQELLARGHAERLIPMMSDLVAEAGIAFADITDVVVSNGPGTFTGARIGVAAARALGLSLDIPVYGVSSLEVLARTARATGGDEIGDRCLAVGISQRHGQVYFQTFDSKLLPRSEPCLVTVADAAAMLGAEAFAVVGSAAEEIVSIESCNRTSISCCIELQPDARFVASPAERAYACGPVRPLYLRPPDAKPQVSPITLRPQSQ